MAKKKTETEKKKISLTPLLWMGIIFVIGTAFVTSIFPGFPKTVASILYVFGLLALIVYMWQKAFERRTGYEELPEKKKSKKKSK